MKKSSLKERADLIGEQMILRLNYNSLRDAAESEPDPELKRQYEEKAEQLLAKARIEHPDWFVPSESS